MDSSHLASLVHPLVHVDDASAEKPYGAMDPNSQHQLWSRWIFGIHADQRALMGAAKEKRPRAVPPLGRRPSVADVCDNARRYFVQLFQNRTGRVRCDEQDGYYVIVLEIEGVAAHDRDLQAFVQRRFTEQFIVQGFGTHAMLSRYVVGVLAGDQQDGQPPDQLLVVPFGEVRTSLYGVPAR